MEIFVSNLSFLVTEDDLDLIFKPFGEVGEIKILHDRQSDLPVALIEMKKVDDARRAIQVLNGVDIIGQSINLRVRNSGSDRRNTSNRRMIKIRRAIAIRRSLQNRRLKLVTLDKGEERSDHQRRNRSERRQISPRRITDNRRILSVRRALA